MKKTSNGITVQMIEVTTWKGSQSVHFRKLVQLNAFKVKLEIKRDSYANQSHAIASVWSAEKLEWNTVYSIPYPQMKTKEGLMYGSAEITSVMFKDDSESLMKGVTSILFPL
jgi:hypothetical protein